jgi:tRNA(Ile)-lysidine synthase TilS/MesJ
MGKLKEELFSWLADEIHDYLVVNGFVFEDDSDDYFQESLRSENFVTEYDLRNAIENEYGNLGDRMDDIESDQVEAEDNIQDVHDRREKGEKFLRNRYGFGDTEEE